MIISKSPGFAQTEEGHKQRFKTISQASKKKPGNASPEDDF